MGITESELAILRQRQADANPTLAPRSKKRRNPTSEAEIQQTCTQILMHDGWRHLRTDPVSDRKRAKGFGEVGMADDLYIRYGGSSPQDMAKDLDAIRDGAQIRGGLNNLAEVLWCEWKRDGGKPEPAQIAWHASERSKGALTLIAGVDFPASVEGFLEFYNKSGLKRGR